MNDKQRTLDRIRRELVSLGFEWNEEIEWNKQEDFDLISMKAMMPSCGCHKNCQQIVTIPIAAYEHAGFSSNGASESLRFYVRNVFISESVVERQSKILQKKIDKILHLFGGAGIGKSTYLFIRVLCLIRPENTVIWIRLVPGKSKYIVLFTKGRKFFCQVATTAELKKVVTFCLISSNEPVIFLDGVRENDIDGVLTSVRTAREIHDPTAPMIVSTTGGTFGRFLQDRDFTRELLPPWELPEYLGAVQCDNCLKTVIEGIKHSAAGSPMHLPNMDDVVAWIKQRFHYGGGSCKLVLYEAMPKLHLEHVLFSRPVDTDPTTCDRLSSIQQIGNECPYRTLVCSGLGKLLRQKNRTDILLKFKQAFLPSGSVDGGVFQLYLELRMEGGMDIYLEQEVVQCRGNHALNAIKVHNPPKTYIATTFYEYDELCDDLTAGFHGDSFLEFTPSLASVLGTVLALPDLPDSIWLKPENPNNAGFDSVHVDFGAQIVTFIQVTIQTSHSLKLQNFRDTFVEIMKHLEPAATQQWLNGPGTWLEVPWEFKIVFLVPISRLQKFKISSVQDASALLPFRSWVNFGSNISSWSKGVLDKITMYGVSWVCKDARK